VYLQIDKYIVRTQSKLEDRKWSRARKEFKPQMPSLGPSLCRAVAHYLALEGGRVPPRENIEAALANVSDKSLSMDSMPAIYAHALPTDWFTAVSQLGDDLRSAAGSARVAARYWLAVARELPRLGDASDGTDAGRFLLTSLNRVKGVRGHRLSADPKEYGQRTFAYYTLLCCDDVARISQRLKDFALTDFEVAELEESDPFIRLTRLQITSAQEYTQDVDRDVQHLRTCTEVIERGGLWLLRAAEFSAETSSGPGGARV